jgi:PhnB protein
MPVHPYLFFEGRCEEAARFYQEALGAEIVMLMRFKDSPDQSMVPSGGAEKVMHMTMRIGGDTIMASDGRCAGEPRFEGFALSLSPPNRQEAERIFAALAEGGQVQMPLTETFFSPCFGVVADKYRVSWMIYVEA